jgi:hypothetical protein
MPRSLSTWSSVTTIRNWARTENWSGQSDDVWRSGGKRTIYELRRGALGIAILSLQTNRDAQTGGLDHLEPWQGALRLKASELGMRLVERGVIALQAFDPPQDDQDTSDLSLQEREAEASARIVQDRKRAIGGRTPMRNTATR